MFIKSQVLWICALTLNTMCNIIWSPAFPGYFPAMLAAVKSNIFAPVSVQMQCTNIFFPTPLGPAMRTDLTNGAFSCMAWDPERTKLKTIKWSSTRLKAINVKHTLGRVGAITLAGAKIWFHLLLLKEKYRQLIASFSPNGRMANSEMTLLTSDREGMGSILAWRSVVPR